MGTKCREYYIEPMRVEHLDEVLAIERASFPTPWSKYAFLGEIRDNRFAHYYVGLYNGRVAAYGGMWVILDEAHITNIAVSPEHRSLKLGKAMLITLMQKAAYLGADKITLEVRPSNYIAQSLYRSLGFVPTGVRKGYYTDTQEDAIIMWRYLGLPQVGQERA